MEVHDSTQEGLLLDLLLCSYAAVQRANNNNYLSEDSRPRLGHIFRVNSVPERCTGSRDG